MHPLECYLNDSYIKRGEQANVDERDQKTKQDNTCIKGKVILSLPSLLIHRTQPAFAVRFTHSRKASRDDYLGMSCSDPRC